MMKSLLKIALPLAFFTETNYRQIKENHEKGSEKNVMPMKRLFNDSGGKVFNRKFEKIKQIFKR